MNKRTKIKDALARMRPAWTDTPVVVNAASLFGSTAITSLLGFCYWLLAARLFPVQAVGVASAAVSAMQLIATAGLLGMGTLMVSELAHGRSPAGLVSAAVFCASVSSAGLGLLYLVVQATSATDIAFSQQGIWGSAVFLAGVALTGATLVIDQASVGIQRGEIQLVRNTVFSVAKLAALPFALLLAVQDAAIGIYAAWLLGNVVSLVTLRTHLWHTGIRPRMFPAFRALTAIRGAALAHHWLNVASQTPRLVLPVLVAATLSPELNAAFYTAVLIVSFATVVPGHLSNALFALPRGQHDRLAEELRGTLRLSAIVGVVSAVLIAVSARFCLSLFGPDYVVATGSMIILGLTTLPFTVKLHYAAVCRIRGQLTWCAAVSTVGAIFEVAAAYVGAKTFGLAGVSAGVLAALCLEAMFLWPSVARSARLPLVYPWLHADQRSNA